MLRALCILTLGISAADHWTTYLCLRTPTVDWEVREANPLAAWLFENIGLAEGLLVDALLTVLAMLFLYTTARLPHKVKLAFLSAVMVFTSYAVVNNFGALGQMGISVLAF